MRLAAGAELPIEADVKEQATVVLENMSLTVSDAIRIPLPAKEGTRLSTTRPFSTTIEAENPGARVKVDDQIAAAVQRLLDADL